MPILKDASLDLIRIEMLNVGLQYMWLDVLCLRQKGGVKEDLRMEEWKLDMPTIRQIYHMNGHERVVIYLSGLGLPFSVKEGDLDSERCWFRHVWTLQEVGRGHIIAGDMPDGPMCAKPIDEDGNYKTELLTRFYKQLWSTLGAVDLFTQLANMQKQVSTNPMEKVAGLAWPLQPKTILAYHESWSLKDAWTALVNSMYSMMQVIFLLVYPGVGLGHKKWRLTWEQVMMETLPELHLNCRGSIQHDDEIDEDRFEGFCIEKEHVHGLDVQSTDGEDRCGELIVESVDRMQHTFAIRAAHQILIPEDTYMLLGSSECLGYRGLLAQLGLEAATWACL